MTTRRLLAATCLLLSACKTEPALPPDSEQVVAATRQQLGAFKTMLSQMPVTEAGAPACEAVARPCVLSRAELERGFQLKVDLKQDRRDLETAPPPGTSDNFKFPRAFWPWLVEEHLKSWDKAKSASTVKDLREALDDLSSCEHVVLYRAVADEGGAITSAHTFQGASATAVAVAFQRTTGKLACATRVEARNSDSVRASKDEIAADSAIRSNLRANLRAAVVKRFPGSL